MNIPANKGVSIAKIQDYANRNGVEALTVCEISIPGKGQQKVNDNRPLLNVVVSVLDRGAERVSVRMSNGNMAYFYRRELLVNQK